MGLAGSSWGSNDFGRAAVYCAATLGRPSRRLRVTRRGAPLDSHVIVAIVASRSVRRDEAPLVHTSSLCSRPSSSLVCSCRSNFYGQLDIPEPPARVQYVTEDRLEASCGSTQVKLCSRRTRCLLRDKSPQMGGTICPKSLEERFRVSHLGQEVSDGISYFLTAFLVVLRSSMHPHLRSRARRASGRTSAGRRWARGSPPR